MNPATMKAVYVLVQAYPEKQISQDTMSLYASELTDIPEGLLALAIKAYINGPTAQWFPAIGQIRAEANRIQNAAQRLPTAEEAWNEASRATRVHVQRRCATARQLTSDYSNQSDWSIARGILNRYDDHIATCQECANGYEDHKFSHPLIEKIARDMGWPHMLTDNEAADRARFIDAYNKAVKTAQDMQGLPPAVRDGINALADRLKSPAIAAGRGGEGHTIAELLPSGVDDRAAAFERGERGTIWQR